MSAILKFSNATPFRGRNALGYVCAYCRNTFPDPGILRRHTHDDHAKHLLAYISVKNLDKLDIYLDTTDLKCTICDARLTKDCGDDLKGFGEHLAGAHGEKFYTEIGDFIYPFKLTTDALMKCCLCAASYSTMKALLEHMNDTHFKNFICPLCGCGFINRQKLKLHEASQHNSKKCFVCPHCEENFDTPWRKRVHVNSVHRGGVGRNVCRICQATFKECYQKHRHMVEAHNHPPLKCEECDKVFYLKSRLLLHHRQTHAKERPFECDICKRGFFDKIRLKEHLVVHTREKKFSCELCGKTYVRIKNLKSHLKSHF